MIIETRAVEPFMKNGYVLGCEATREGVIVDPGDEVDLLLEAATSHRLHVAYILLTHAHMRKDRTTRCTSCGSTDVIPQIALFEVQTSRKSA